MNIITHNSISTPHLTDPLTRLFALWYGPCQSGLRCVYAPSKRSRSCLDKTRQPADCHRGKSAHEVLYAQQSSDRHPDDEPQRRGQHRARLARGQPICEGCNEPQQPMTEGRFAPRSQSPDILTNAGASLFYLFLPKIFITSLLLVDPPSKSEERVAEPIEIRHQLLADRPNTA